MTGVVLVSNGCRGEGGGGGKRTRGEEQHNNQLSLVALLLAAIRRSMVSCRVDRQEEVMAAVQKMEIGLPTDVRHITHVTFDRFNGFLGLPVEFEVEIPCRVPSASASVFGVSPESMQCCYDPKGNSVPTILLLMQERLYSQGGLKAEGIFRINPENSQEEHVRDQLNRGIVPDDIDDHCLAGLIKAWFRELPAGVLDSLSPEQVLQCNTEEEFVELVKLLLPMQAALLNWAVELMADVVEEEDVNKMNARNIAMVFAPNMTQMSDPLTALMHAVQVMNLLKTLILKTLREREEAAMGGFWPSPSSSGQEGDSDSDSQQEMEVSSELMEQTSEDDHVSNYQQEMNMSSELRKHPADDEHPSDGECPTDDEHPSDGEFPSDNDVDEPANYVNFNGNEADCMEEIQDCFLKQLGWTEGTENQGLECINPDTDSGYQARQSDLNMGSCLSITESKQESSSPSHEVDSVTSLSSIEVLKEKSRPPNQIDKGLDIEMVKL